MSGGLVTVDDVARVIHRHTFSARESGEDWDRVLERAEAGGGYAGHVVDQCRRCAMAIAVLLNGG